MFGHEAKMEQSEQVGELIQHALRLPPHRGIGADEIAELQVFQGLGQCAARRQFECFLQLLLRHAFPVADQFLNHLTGHRGVLEQRAKQEIVFRAQRCAIGEKEPVDVLGEGEVFVEHVYIIRYAAENHVGLGDLVARPNDAFLLQLRLHLAQGERRKIDGARTAVVKSALVANDLVHHPRGGTAADKEFQPVAGGCPSVPEIAEGRQELGFGRVHPRQLVEKHDDALFSEAAQIGLKLLESLKPVGWPPQVLPRPLLQLPLKQRQLHRHRGFVTAGKHEVELVVEKLPDEEGLPHPAAAIHRHHSCLALFANRFKQLLLILPSYDSVVVHGFISLVHAAKINLFSERHPYTRSKSPIFS